MSDERMRVSIPYGRGEKLVEMSRRNLVGIARINDLPEVKDVELEVKNSIDNPIGASRLEKIVGGEERVAIVVSDITRPPHAKYFMPYLLSKLRSAGCKKDNIDVVVARGFHRSPTPKELRYLLGEELPVRVSCHDAKDKENLVDFGKTSHGTPIWINRTVAEADVKILTGVITPHSYAGFSGGRKSIVPGVAGKESIEYNHRVEWICFHSNTRPGVVNDNPIHNDAMEAAKRLGVDFIVNSVANSEKKIVKVVSGDLAVAWEEGIKLSKKMFEVKVPKEVDVCIVSPGGYPYDMNLYQSNGAIIMPSWKVNVVKQGGTVIALAECPDGVGVEGYYRWLKEAKKPSDVIDQGRREGVLGPAHAALALATSLPRARIILVSENITREMAREMFLETASSAQSALDKCIETVGRDARVLVIPHGRTILT